MHNVRLIFVLSAICLATAAFAQTVSDTRAADKTASEKVVAEKVASEKAGAEQIKPERVIHYRQSAMTLIGWNFSALGAMVKSKTPFDAREFSRRAERLEFLGPQLLEGFSKGSDTGAETDAKAEIWTHFDDFQAKLDDYVNESKKLAEVAKGGNEAAMKEQFKKTAESCKACHDKYRAE